MREIFLVAILRTISIQVLGVYSEVLCVLKVVGSYSTGAERILFTSKTKCFLLGVSYLTFIVSTVRKIFIFVFNLYIYVINFFFTVSVCFILVNMPAVNVTRWLCLWDLNVQLIQDRGSHCC